MGDEVAGNDPTAARLAGHLQEVRYIGNRVKAGDTRSRATVPIR